MIVPVTRRMSVSDCYLSELWCSGASMWQEKTGRNNSFIDFSFVVLTLILNFSYQQRENNVRERLLPLSNEYVRWKTGLKIWNQSVPNRQTTPFHIKPNAIRSLAYLGVSWRISYPNLPILLSHLTQDLSNTPLWHLPTQYGIRWRLSSSLAYTRIVLLDQVYTPPLCTSIALSIRVV